MSSNQTVLEALAKEGVITTEEALLRAVKDQPTISAPGFSAPGMPPLEDLVVMARPPLADGALPVRLGTPRETAGTTRSETETEHPVSSSNGEGGEPAQGTNGIWRRMCALAGIGMCHFGIHPAPWEYLREGECNQLRDCQRCATTRMRVKHRRSWRYVGPETCIQTKVCQRCDHRESSRTNHEAWSKSWSVGGGEEAHRCKRCGEVETYSTDCGD